ncbi:MAG: amino acid ABC transporter substrate-binding protein [Woeseiaceae bacterium]|nr:amino acid ABC transporter substrate-binding protein [Woeseiaceae bacterium]
MLRRIAFLLALAVACSSAMADSPTLERIAETGEFRIGYVPDAPPLSFKDFEGDAIGYSVDLCKHIAATVKDHLGLEKLETSFVPLVSMEDRISAVEKGDVDIECGATTVTLSRRERVDFTLMTFITGSAILSRISRPINTLDDAGGKTIAAIRGTTTEAVVRRFAEINEIPIKLALIDTHDEGMELLNAGRVDGYASDRAMLIGQVFRADNAKEEYAMSRGALSFEPYAMMIRRGDSEFRLVADRALAELFRGIRIRRLHQIWFGQLGEPMTPVVEAMYQFQAVGE